MSDKSNTTPKVEDSEAVSNCNKKESQPFVQKWSSPQRREVRTFHQFLIPTSDLQGIQFPLAQ